MRRRSKSIDANADIFSLDKLAVYKTFSHLTDSVKDSMYAKIAEKNDYSQISDICGRFTEQSILYGIANASNQSEVGIILKENIEFFRTGYDKIQCSYESVRCKHSVGRKSVFGYQRSERSFYRKNGGTVQKKKTAARSHRPADPAAVEAEAAEQVSAPLRIIMFMKIPMSRKHSRKKKRLTT